MEHNLADLLARAAADDPDQTAVTEGTTGRSVTWGELDDLVDQVFNGLSAAGVVAGYRVMIALGNRIEFVAAYLGCLRARVVAVPANPRSTVGEFARILADSGAKLAIVEDRTAAPVREAVAQVAPPARIVTVDNVAETDEILWPHFLTAERVEPIGTTDPESVAALLYTSGTSGLPRGAMLSHRALRSNIEQVAAVEPAMITPADVVLGVVPLFHVYGLNAVLGQALRQRCRLVLVDGFDPGGVLRLIDDEQITVLPVAPAVFAYWMQIPDLADHLGSVRLALSGSAPISPDLVTAFTARTGVVVHQGYGLTEAAPVVTSTLCAHPDDPEYTPDPRSVGALVPGIELRLIDEDGGEIEGDDPGEVWIRGANLFSGYWPDGADGPDDSGWWATGDVGYLAESELFLVDRVKELIIVSGFNVYPSEVEDVIGEVPGVGQVAVIGTADEISGERVVAYVRPVPDADRDTLVERVREHCVERLARFKQPSAITIVDDLPQTVTGKVQKGRLREAQRRRALGVLE